MGKLEGKVAIVTGSSMGIGEAIARLYAQEGAKVVINSRSLERAARVANDMVAKGFSAIPVEADVSYPEGAQKLVDAAVKEWGRLDILVNNAGVSAIAPSTDLAPDHFMEVLRVNLGGPFFCSQAAARVMIPQGGGVIINISSIYGHVGVPRRAAYCSSKHGLNGLTKVLASEWARSNIRVVALNPGYIYTPMEVSDVSTGDYTSEDIMRRTPMARYGTAEEVAKVALFLASDDAAYITGSAIIVDGGWLAFGAWERSLEVKQ